MLLSFTLLFFLSDGSTQAPEPLNQAIQEFRAAEYTSAEHSLVEFIHAHPRSLPAHSLLGLVFMEQKRYTSAVAEFNVTLRLDPRAASAYVNLGNALVELHKDEKALVEYKRALSIHPEDAVALSSAGLIYARQHDGSRAAEYLERAHQLDHGDVHTTAALAAAYIDTKKFDSAVPLVDELIQSGSGAGDVRLSLAELSLENGNPEFGSRCVEGDLILQGKYADQAYIKAEAMMAASQYHEALRMLKSASPSAQGAADYHDLLGIVYYRLDDPAKSADELQTSIRLDPFNPDHYYKLGMMFLKHRTGDGAVVVFNTALSKRPDVPKLWMGLGLSYYIEGDIKSAKVKLYRAIQLDPRYGPAFVVLCDLLSQTGGDDELLQIIGKAMVADPADYLLAYYYGKTLARRNDQGAISQFQKSIALNPSFSGSYFELGRALAASGDTPGAIDALSRGLDIDPDMAEAHYALYRIYHTLGKQQLATDHIEAFQRIRKQNGDDERVQRLLYTIDK